MRRYKLKATYAYMAFSSKNVVWCIGLGWCNTRQGHDGMTVDGTVTTSRPRLSKILDPTVLSPCLLEQHNLHCMLSACMCLRK